MSLQSLVRVILREEGVSRQLRVLDALEGSRLAEDASLRQVQESVVQAIQHANEGFEQERFDDDGVGQAHNRILAMLIPVLDQICGLAAAVEDRKADREYHAMGEGF